MFKSMTLDEFNDWLMENEPELFEKLLPLRYMGPYTFDNALTIIKKEYEDKG